MQTAKRFNETKPRMFSVHPAVPLQQNKIAPFSHGVLFALRVHGKSMIKVGIQSGDLAIIRQQPTVETGEIAAVRLGNEATLKRFCQEHGRINLKAENDNEPDIQVDDRLGMDMRILGLFVGLIRQAR